MEIKVTWPGFVCLFVMAKTVLVNNYFVNEFFCLWLVQQNTCHKSVQTNQSALRDTNKTNRVVIKVFS